MKLLPISEELATRLEIKIEFAMLGSTNPVMMRGRLPENREEILAALDSIICDIGEDRLRFYRTNLRHL